METEQEELEALQKWWKENGRAVVIGLVLGLGGVFGWTTWQNHVETSAEQLSVAYQNMVDTAARNQHAEAVQKAEVIIIEHPGSEYAALAGLLGAKSALADGQPGEAKRMLDTVIEDSDRTELRDIARMRKARVLLDEGAGDAGLAILEQVRTTAFAASVDELRGDILMGGGNAEAAAKAYDAALASLSLAPAMRARLQMKRDDLGYQKGDGVTQ